MSKITPPSKPLPVQTTVADASTAHALSALYADTEVETALNNLGTKVNAILSRLEALGLFASS